MAGKDPFAAQLLRTSGSAYAAYAANLLLERRPEVEKRSGDGAFHSWKSHLTQCLLDLAAAVAEGEPELFASWIGWSREALGAREVPEEDLRASLECLRDVLREELPEIAREAPCELLDGALETFTRPAATKGLGLDPEQPGERLALEYLRAALEGDGRRATRLVVDSVGNGLGVREAYLDVLLPAQKEVGRMWHAAEATVAEEHFVTATTQRTMAILSHRAAPEPHGKTVVAATVAGNVHDVGLRTVADFFEIAGWRSVCLGADVPPADVASAVRFFKPSLVLLSASLATQLETLRQTIEAVRSVPDQDAKVLVGGLAFAHSPELWKGLGADGHAPTPDDAVALGERLAGLG